MRTLTEAELQLRNQRQDRLEQMLAERMPVLADFAEALGLENPTGIVVTPDAYLASIDLFLKNQVIESDDWIWIETRLGYFIGEYLVQRLGGCWFLDEIPDSRFFLHIVVGQFSSIANRQSMVDPFLVAMAFLKEPPERGLAKQLALLEKELAFPPGTNSATVSAELS